MAEMKEVDAQTQEAAFLEQISSEQGFSVLDLEVVGAEMEAEDWEELSPILEKSTVPLEPTIDTNEKEFADRFVEYPHTRRSDRDVILSGPVIGGWGPGRYHQNRALARQHLIEKYGADRVRTIGRYIRGRWAFMVLNLREA